MCKYANLIQPCLTAGMRNADERERERERAPVRVS